MNSSKYLDSAGLTYLWEKIQGKLDTKADDNKVVHLAGAETISGLKTFTAGLNLNTGSSWTDQDRTVPFSSTDSNRCIRYINADANAGLTYNPHTGALKSGSFVKRGGTAAQFLKADGSVDSNSYATTSTLSNYLLKSGGTMTGDLTMSANKGIIMPLGSYIGFTDGAGGGSLILRDHVFYVAGADGKTRIMLSKDNTDSGVLGIMTYDHNDQAENVFIVGKNMFTFNNNAIYHAGNLPNFAGSQTSGGAANKAVSIPYAQVDSTSTATAFTATVDGITELRDGVCCLLKNGVVTSASGFTLDINSLGAKPCYTNLAAATRDTTIFNVNYTMLFVYDSTRVDGGGWICYRGYDSNSNTIGYDVRENNNGGKKLKTDMTRYQLVMTTMDDMLLPVYSGAYTTATTKVLTTESFNPFGQIYYYGTTTKVTANGTVAKAYLYAQATDALVNLNYSFNTGTTLTAGDDIYLVCVPQNDGSVKLHTSPIAKSLPTTEDGLVYKRLGKAHDDYRIILELDKPCYYYKDGAVRLWTNQYLNMETLANYINSGEYERQYFTFEAIEDCVFTRGHDSVQYSIDGGNTWVDGNPPTVSAGNKILWKGWIGENPNSLPRTFTSTGKFNVYGNVMSLVYGDNFVKKDDLQNINYILRSLLSGSKVVNADKLILPASDVSSYGYYKMFANCAELISAPELPALTLQIGAYSQMFQYCTALERAPILPCEYPPDYAYYLMFDGCTSLTYIETHQKDTSNAANVNWVVGVGSQGEFVKDKNAQFETGRNGIPTGWSIRNLSSEIKPIKWITIYSDRSRASIGLHRECAEHPMYISYDTKTWQLMSEGISYNIADSPDQQLYVCGQIDINTTYTNTKYVSFFMNDQAGASGNEYVNIFGDASALYNGLKEVGGTNYCCYKMFEECELLYSAPKFSDTTTYSYEYAQMFNGCTNLYVVGNLPATELGDHCYYEMFYACESLETPPELPATYLNRYCYGSMFAYCTSLLYAPKLPAPKLEAYCYNKMFYECPLIDRIDASFITTKSNSLTNWLNGVSATGTFIKNSKATWDVSGVSGVPTGWDILTTAEIPWFSASDNGKVLGVVDGKLAWVNAATS